MFLQKVVITSFLLLLNVVINKAAIWLPNCSIIQFFFVFRDNIDNDIIFLFLIKSELMLICNRIHKPKYMLLFTFIRHSFVLFELINNINIEFNFVVCIPKSNLHNNNSTYRFTGILYFGGEGSSYSKKVTVENAV